MPLNRQKALRPLRIESWNSRYKLPQIVVLYFKKNKFPHSSLQIDIVSKSLSVALCPYLFPSRYPQPC